MSGTAFSFRMGAGFPGDVSRHFASIEPALICPTSPPTAYGQGVVIDQASNGVRPLGASDTSITALWGITVRPYPIQQPQTNQDYGAVGFGAATPPTSGAIDVNRLGYSMTSLPAGSAAVKKGSPVFIWCAASTGNHVQGGFESAASGGNTAALDPEFYQFNGPADSNGNVEVSMGFVGGAGT